MRRIGNGIWANAVLLPCLKRDLNPTSKANYSLLALFVYSTVLLFMMTHIAVKQHPSLYLQVSFQNEEPRLPLHTSIALFLLSYCECKSFKVFLVFTKPASSRSLKSRLPESLDVSDIQWEDVPQLVRGCRLPAVLDETGRLCRAGLAVVLRHIINMTLEADPSRNDVLALLGFKKTCLKACAEVSCKLGHTWPNYKEEKESLNECCWSTARFTEEAALK